ncbi:MAG: type II secretion system GspH family protein [Thiovulaceae bacterium]|nr:type II secretion system GspH family protein [Sulfurimonadaceae bacterium]
MKKSAFTMIELIIVIVVAGILAAVMIPRLERDSLREAANQLVRHIQYTQHLAMVDDVYDAGDTSWYQNRWSINLCSTAYAVERANGSATAVDTLTQRDIDGTDNDLANMGVSISPTTGNCRVVFDDLGRPYSFVDTPVFVSPVDSLNTADKVITLTADGRTATINVTKETGFVKITTLN